MKNEYNNKTQSEASLDIGRPPFARLALTQALLHTDLPTTETHRLWSRDLTRNALHPQVASTRQGTPPIDIVTGYLIPVTSSLP